MNIQELLQKSKYILRKLLLSDAYIAVIIVLVGVASFGLGRLSALPGKEPVRIYQGEAEAAAAMADLPARPTKPESVQKVVRSIVDKSAGATPSAEGNYVASKNGSVYYPPTCSGAARIKDENKIWFDSTTAAENAGYHAAANCKTK